MARGYEVVVIEPSQFYTIPLPRYPDIRLALFPRRRIGRVIEEHKPDAIHLMTEGPLGWAARSVSAKRGYPLRLGTIRISSSTSIYVYVGSCALSCTFSGVSTLQRPAQWSQPIVLRRNWSRSAIKYCHCAARSRCRPLHPQSDTASAASAETSLCVFQPSRPGEKS